MVDMYWRIRRAPDQEYDRLAQLVYCVCGHVNFDLLTCVGRTASVPMVQIDPPVIRLPCCDRCGRIIRITPSIERIITSADVIRKEVLPVLRRNGEIPSRCVTTTILPLPPDVRSTSLSHSEIDSIFAVIEASAPGYLDALGGSAAILAKSRRLIIGLSRSFPVAPIPHPVADEDIYPWSRVDLNIAAQYAHQYVFSLDGHSDFMPVSVVQKIQCLNWNGWPHMKYFGDPSAPDGDYDSCKIPCPWVRFVQASYVDGPSHPQVERYLSHAESTDARKKAQAESPGNSTGTSDP